MSLIFNFEICVWKSECQVFNFVSNKNFKKRSTEIYVEELNTYMAAKFLQNRIFNTDSSDEKLNLNLVSNVWKSTISGLKILPESSIFILKFLSKTEYLVAEILVKKLIF